MFFRDLLDLYVLRKCVGLPAPELWERAFATYMDLLRTGKLEPTAAKEAMDEALAYLDREGEAQARWEREEVMRRE